MHSTIRVEDFSSEMMAELAIISDSFFGDNYFHHHIYPLYLQQASSQLKIALVAPNLVAGFAFGFSVSKAQLSSLINLAALPPLPLSENIGILNTVVIRKEFQHQHIAKLLASNILQEFQSQHIRSCFAVGWKNNSIIEADKLNQAIHFQIIGEQPDYWYHDSLQQKFNCSVCGKTCHCSAIIYYRALS
ncbi:MAG: hypothetical protein PHR53_05630 [Bacteroidales bacterium]|nr:hypothetical protein [Bacteroidales bacterium]